MPLLLKIIVLLAGGLYLVDQSLVVSQSHPMSQPQEVCNTNHCNETPVASVEKTPLNSATQYPLRSANNTNSTNNTYSELLVNISTPEEKEDGIEGTGFKPIDDQHTTSDYVDYRGAIAEGGIEGTGIYGGPYEDLEPLENDSNDDYDADEGGIEGTGILAGAENQLIAYGPITQFGSIYVNGTKYEIDDAELEFVNDTGASELSIGMMVQVHADWQQQANGVFNAQKVIFDHQIEGPISTIDRHGDVTLLKVLGTTIVVTSDTALDRSVPARFNVGSVVTVNGITNEKDQLLATYIALRSNEYHEGQQIELEGIVDTIIESDQIIQLNEVNIDVSQAKWKQGNLQTLLLGARVEIIGKYDASTNRIIANQVRVKKNDLSLNKGNKFNIDTIVTHYTSIGQFRLNGYAANASKAEILHGKYETLGNGVRVKATGYINIDGIFEVYTLRIKQNSNFAVKTQVSSVNPTTGEIGFLNIEAYTLPDTTYQSKLKSPNKYFSINDIQVGDWIEIQGVEEGKHFTINNLFALRNKRQMIIKGAVNKGDNDRLLLLGIEIQPTGTISPELVSSIKDKDTIVAKGIVFDGNTFYARELIIH